MYIPPTLTEVEAEIVNLLRLGYTCRAACTMLGISINTGKNRIARARKRMDCETNLQLVAEYAVLRAVAPL